METLSVLCLVLCEKQEEARMPSTDIIGGKP